MWWNWTVLFIFTQLLSFKNYSTTCDEKRKNHITLFLYAICRHWLQFFCYQKTETHTVLKDSLPMNYKWNKNAWMPALFWWWIVLGISYSWGYYHTKKEKLFLILDNCTAHSEYWNTKQKIIQFTSKDRVTYSTTCYNQNTKNTYPKDMKKNNYPRLNDSDKEKTSKWHSKEN